MDLPVTTPGQRTPVQAQQQRPSLAYYFLLFSLLLYLVNSSPTSGSFGGSSGDDSAGAFARARAGLLRREARAEGLARWLGEANGTSDWLNSTFWPDVANGTAPPPEAENSTSTSLEFFRIPPFALSNETELPPVVPLVQRLFASTEQAGLFPQNLTGFGKGSWEVRRFDWAELGLNETWSEERLVEVTPEGKNTTVADSAGAANGPEPATDGARLVNRQTGGEEAPAVNATAPSHNFTTTTDTFNRTLLRGSFPWAASLAPSSGIAEQRVSLNLRSLQTSAVGPVLPLREGMSELDDGELLQLKGDEAQWDDWEKEGPVVYLGGEIELKSAEEETSLDLEAVHFLSSGKIYGFATPSFVASHLYQTVSLPFAVSAPLANRTAHAIGHANLRELRRRIENSVTDLKDSTRIEENRGDGGGGRSGEDWDTPRCIFSLFGALSPLPHSFDRETYAESYASLFHPSGSSAPSLPPAVLNAVLSSHNCGLVLSLPSTRINLTQSYWAEGVSFVIALAAAQAVIVAVLVRQMERVQGRHGTIANVAIQGIAAMCLVDAYLGTTLLTVAIVTYTRASLPLICAAFFGILSSLLFGMRYIALIRESTPDRPPIVPAPTATPPRDGAEGSQDGGEADGSLRGVGSGGPTREQQIFIGTIFFLAAFAFYLLFWWGWTALLLWCLYSYWVPQIVRNVYRGTARQSLSAEYVIGNTLARLVLPLYFWGREGNCMQVETSRWVYLLAAYSLLQATILLLQSRLSSPSSSSSPLDRLLARLNALGGGGARFFIPLRLIRTLNLPELNSWNYHPPVVPASLLADLTSTPDLEAAKGVGEAGVAEPDCPICLTGVQVVPMKEDLANGRADEVRRQCAITPCKHVVHTECLEQWMLVRAICPVCRSGLPPLR
ncbi:hypothetical protein JCM10213_005324 [Rhodosporidiobolus nylandii]